MNQFSDSSVLWDMSYPEKAGFLSKTQSSADQPDRRKGSGGLKFLATIHLCEYSFSFKI
jgi:hypothetical protein